MLEDNYVTFEIGKAKHIALVAHDGKKKELVDWCDKNKDVLKSHFLCGTGTTARLIAERTGLPVKGYNSGPLGGDQQIGAKIVEGQIDFMIFLRPSLTTRMSRLCLESQSYMTSRLPTTWLPRTLC